MNKCPYCQRNFKNPGALASHIRLKHKATPTVDVAKLQSTIRHLFRENEALLKENWKLKDQLYVESVGHSLLFQQGKYCQHCGELLSEHRQKPGIMGQIVLCPKDFK